MAKPKRSTSSGLRKAHKGPKRHLFKDFKPMVWQFGKIGLLTKFNNEESFILAMQARGNKKVCHTDWENFKGLSLEAKKAYFKNYNKN